MTEPRKDAPLLVHGSCVAVEGRGALFTGPPGSGKSDLALRLIERGAQLIADDQVRLEVINETLRAGTEPRLQGRIEMRGIGIIKVPFVRAAPLLAVFNLVDASDVSRAPDPEWTELVAGHPTRIFRLSPFEASAPDKVRLTLAALSLAELTRI